MMPRITPLRLVCWPVLGFVFGYIFLVTLWVTLPSPSRNHGDSARRFEQDTLRAGKRLTTVYDGPAYKYRSIIEYEDERRSHYGIDWQLVKDYDANSIMLRIGETACVNLTRLASLTTPYAEDAFNVTARAGDIDGVNLPWFDETDAALLYWEIHKDSTIFSVRAVGMKPGEVRIWPATLQWSGDVLETPDVYWDIDTFIAISNIPIIGQRTDLSQIEVEAKTASVPTMTFAIRRFVLLTLMPITLVLIPVFEHVIIPSLLIVVAILRFLFLLALVGAGLTLGCWWSSGRPDFDVWARDFWITKWMYRRSRTRYIRGPSGLMVEIDGDDEAQVEHPRAHGPQPLNGPLDFFRSRSPLDDLFVTFDSTRWLVEPLSRSSQSTQRRFEPSDGITISLMEEGKSKSVG